MNPSGIQPLGSYLLLDVTPQEQTTAAGIVLPTAVQGPNTRMEAVIAARGPDCTRADLPCGTRVYVSRYASSELPRGERSYKLALETDIIATLSEITVTLAEARITPIPTL